MGHPVPGHTGGHPSALHAGGHPNTNTWAPLHPQPCRSSHPRLWQPPPRTLQWDAGGSSDPIPGTQLWLRCGVVPMVAGSAVVGWDTASSMVDLAVSH